MRGVKGVGEEVHEGVPHEGAHGEGHQQGEQGLAMSPLQKGHRTHSRQTNLDMNINPDVKVTATSINLLMDLTKDMTVIEEKLTSQVAMETEAA